METDDPLLGTYPETIIQEVDDLLAASQALFETGRVDEALERADAAVVLAGRHGLESAIGWGLVRRASALARRADHEGCLAACAEATARFTALDEPLGIARALSLAAVVLAYTGRIAEGVGAAAESLATVDRITAPSVDLAATHCNLGSVQLFLGDHDAAELHDEKAVAIAREVGAERECLSFLSQAIARIVDATRRDWQGGLDADARARAAGALEMAGSALADARRLESPLHSTILAAYLAYFLLRTGRPSEAIEALDGVPDAARGLGQPQIEGFTMLTLGAALRELGRLAEASERLEEGLRHARSLDFQGMQADAHFERTLLFEALGWHQDATAEFRRFYRAGERLRRAEGAQRLPVIALRTSLQVADSERERQRIAELSRLVDDLWSESRRLAKASLEDPLTGLPNRRHLDAVIAERTDQSGEPGRWMCVAMIDVDRFKSVNDRYGHIVGDAVLRGVADIMRRQLRERDVAARFGGDEFAVVLFDTEPAAALQAFERFRAAVAANDWSRVGPDLEVTVSVGLAASNTPACVASLVERADDALYLAKDGGRDRVVLGTRTGTTA